MFLQKKKIPSSNQFVLLFFYDSLGLYFKSVFYAPLYFYSIESIRVVLYDSQFKITFTYSKLGLALCA